jgi:phospholipase C
VVKTWSLPPQLTVAKPSSPSGILTTILRSNQPFSLVANMRFRNTKLSLIYSICALALSVALPSRSRAEGTLDLVSNILIVYMENHSFDNLFGQYPGVDGIENAGAHARQTDRSGKPYEHLPPTKDPFTGADNPTPLRAVEALVGLPNKPFRIDGVLPEVSIATVLRDLRHRFYTHRAQIHGGGMDQYAAWSDAGALVMGHYSREALESTPLWRLAHKGVLMDHFFQGSFGGSFLNHFWLICGCSPVWPDVEDDLRSHLDANGAPVDGPLGDNIATAKDFGDFAVNTVQSVFLNDGKQGKVLLPGQSAQTIGDMLTAKGVDWRWYSGGWDLAKAQERTAEQEDHLVNVFRFQWHHQPFAYFERFNPGTDKGREERNLHLKGEPALEEDIVDGKLPPVAFYKPAGILNEHPGYAGIVSGAEHIEHILHLLEQSPIKNSFAMIIVYDEYGGFWDHVSPPKALDVKWKADAFGPGSRVPAILISPLAPKGVVVFTEYDTTAILKLIQDRFRLDPLPSCRVNAQNSMAKLFTPGASLAYDQKPAGPESQSEPPAFCK